MMSLRRAAQTGTKKASLSDPTQRSRVYAMPSPSKRERIRASPSLADGCALPGAASLLTEPCLFLRLPARSFAQWHSGERTAFTAAGPFGIFTRFLFDRDRRLEPPWIFSCVPAKRRNIYTNILPPQRQNVKIGAKCSKTLCHNHPP